MELRKHTLVYFFSETNKEKDISYHYKALSNLEWLSEDFIFYAVRNPSDRLLKEYFIKSLPAVRGALAPMKEDEEADADSIK